MFDPFEREVLEVVEATVGTWTTSAGPLAPPGLDLRLRVVDVLTVTGGRISAITMVADELGALVAVGAVRLPLGS